MKLSKQERIGLLIIIAVVILALGGFLLFKPKVEEAMNSKAEMVKKEKEFNEKNETADTMGPLKDSIMEAYKNGAHMADMFFTEMRPYETDNMFREFLENRSYTKPGDSTPQPKAEVLIEELTVTEPAVVELQPIVPAVNPTVYPLKEFATQGASAVTNPTMARNALLAAALGGKQQLSATTVSLTIRAISQDELIKFSDELNNFVRDENGEKTRKAVMASGIALTYPNITKKYDKMIEKLAEEAKKLGYAELEKNTGLKPDDNQTQGSNIPEPGPTEPNKDKVSMSDWVYGWETTLTFYSIERMQDPSPILKAQDDSVQ